MDFHLNFPYNVSFEASCSINIVSFDRSFESLEGKVSLRKEFIINKVSSSAAVNNCRSVDDFCAHGKFE